MTSEVGGDLQGSAEPVEVSEPAAAGNEDQSVAVASAKKTSKERKRARSTAIERLLDEARAEAASAPTDKQKLNFFREWENSERTILAAHQMLKDAYKRRDEAVATLVKRLGPGPYRWRDKLYCVSANGETVYLKLLKERSKD